MSDSDERISVFTNSNFPHVDSGSGTVSREGHAAPHHHPRVTSGHSENGLFPFVVRRKPTLAAPLVSSTWLINFFGSVLFKAEKIARACLCLTNGGRGQVVFEEEALY